MARTTKKVEDTVATTLAERGNTHGEFTDVAIIDRQFKDVLVNSPNFATLSDDKKLALDMITHKMARILCGNPEALDHWHDIEGYSRLAKDRCKVN